MDRNAIVLYNSWTGFTRNYAQLMAQALDCPALPLSEAPADLSGVSAEFDGKTLSLRYDDILIDAGVCSGTELSPFWAVPSLLRAMGEGYLLEVCREDLRDIPCLRAAFEITAEDGGKTVYTVWLSEENQPVRGEITVEETLVYGVDFTSFTKEGEYDGGTDAATDVGGD